MTPDVPPLQTLSPGDAPGAAAAGDARFAAVAPHRWKTPTARDRLRWTAAWLAALLAHGSALYVLVQAPYYDPMPGGGGQQIEAISITLASSGVLESRTSEPAPPAASAPKAPVDASDGAPDAASAPATRQEEEKKEEREAKDAPKERPQDEPVHAAEAILEPPQEQARKQQQSAAAAAGGASARSHSIVEQPASASAPAAASAGAVRDYGRYVALALSKGKPKGIGGHGTVQVRFTIAPDGTLALAAVARSSGNQKLDDAALEAVRRTKFPTPPAGMTVVQLTYQVPYHFR